MTAAFLRACLLGFSVAAPVGPIGILCIRRTLADGRGIGLACGLGAATADTLYGLVAGLGLTSVAGALVAWQTPVRLVGGAWLAWLGVTTLLARPATEAAPAAGGGRALGAWGSTFLLTLTNPLTILSFAAMFTAIVPVEAAPTAWRAPVLAGGVFLGSAAWWLLLSGLADRLRGRLGERQLAWVNRCAGFALLGFAAWSVAGLAAGG